MKDPAFLFYSADFIVGTLLMTNEQVGKYIKLMCLQHQKGHLCEKDMLNICLTYEKDIFEKFAKDESGKYYNERLEEEILKRKKYSESRANNRKSIKKENINNKDIFNISLTYDEHMENEDINININKDINNINKEKKIEIKKTIEDREKLFIENLHVFIPEYGNETIIAFFNYWSEKTQGGQKMRFETEKTWEIKKRLNTWKNNEQKFKNNGNRRTEKQDDTLGTHFVSSIKAD
jgi:hypothetical protein